MSNDFIHTFDDIDWTSLRRNAMSRKGWKRKGPKEWDRKAGSFSSRTKKNDYIDLFLRELPLDPSSTVLDIGSGPGTLSLPISAQVERVTAVDFSAGMLEILSQRAAEEGRDNITTVQCAWEDDWKEKSVSPHDIAIASRSIGVDDLESALLKINAFAKKYVFISDRIGPTPFEAQAFRAIGRAFEPGPDYIYTLNILYKLGIYPNITVLRPQPITVYPSIKDALDSYRWMFQELTDQEEIGLTDYLNANIIEETENSITIKRNTPIQWALIWWKK